jgi:hypothetical protein
MSRTGLRGSVGRRSTSSLDISKYATFKIAQLRKAREEQVEALNFEEVQVIDAAIQNLESDNTQQVIDDLSKSLADTIESACAVYRTGVDEQTRIANAQTLAAREETNRKFQSTEARHIEELADLEDARGLDEGLHKRRPSARGIEMKKVAKSLARTQKVELAIVTRNEADRTEKAELVSRAEAVNASYDARQQILLGQQTVELNQLQNLLTQRLDQIELKKSQAIELLKKTAVATIREDLRKKIASGHAQLTKKERASEVADVLIAWVREKLDTDERRFIFEATAP